MADTRELEARFWKHLNDDRSAGPVRWMLNRGNCV